MTVYAGETALGSIDILPSRNMEDFQLYTIPLKAYSERQTCGWWSPAWRVCTGYSWDNTS